MYALTVIDVLMALLQLCNYTVIIIIIYTLLLYVTWNMISIEEGNFFVYGKPVEALSKVAEYITPKSTIICVLHKYLISSCIKTLDLNPTSLSLSVVYKCVPLLSRCNWHCKYGCQLGNCSRVCSTLLPWHQIRISSISMSIRGLVYCQIMISYIIMQSSIADLSGSKSSSAINQQGEAISCHQVHII